MTVIVLSIDSIVVFVIDMVLIEDLRSDLVALNNACF